MFKNLVEALQKIATTSNRQIFDPTLFQDPVANNTGWTPAKNGGTNFRTHRLVETNLNRMEFKPTVGVLIFYSIFLLIGLGLMVGFSFARIASHRFALTSETIIPILMGAVFFITGLILFYFGTKPIVFDRGTRFYWRGRKSPNQTFDKSILKEFASFEDIHALQIISEFCQGEENSFYSYELNLVLQDARRINVIDHGNLMKLQEDAQKLAAFLGKPLWDVHRIPPNSKSHPHASFDS